MDQSYIFKEDYFDVNYLTSGNLRKYPHDVFE